MVLFIEHVILLFGFGNIIIVHLGFPVEPSFIHIDHNNIYPRPGLEADMGITYVFLSVLFHSLIFLLKMKIRCLPSLQEDWQKVPFIDCCCGVMRYALYSWRLSKKLFTSQYIQNRSHVGLKKNCQAVFVFIDINVDPPCPQFNVIRISQTDVYLPTHFPNFVAQYIKMYLSNVLLKMGQGPYVFIIYNNVPSGVCLKLKIFNKLTSASQFPPVLFLTHNA